MRSDIFVSIYESNGKRRLGYIRLKQSAFNTTFNNTIIKDLKEP